MRTCTIIKRQFLVTVLSRSDDPLEFDSLADLEHAISEGSHIGQWEQTFGPVVVPEDQVVAELKAIANDGTFFVDPDDENGNSDRD